MEKKSKTDRIIAACDEVVLPVYARAPLALVRGEGCVLTDADGKSYLDFASGIAVNALGYGDAGLRKAVEEALDTGLFHTSNLFYTEPQARLAKLLCDNSFAKKVHFSLSGADANEGAIKFARRYARAHGHADKYHVIAFQGAFHGRLFGSLAMTPRPAMQDPFRPLMPGVRFANLNDLSSVREQIDRDVCAMIVEPVQAEGGIHPASTEFLQGLRALADEFGALLIFDEVQTGLGRTGTLWGYQHSNVTPDLLTVAKPLAGGLPMAAILMTQAVADTIQKGDHAGTLGGNPFTSHVAAHVVQRIADPAFLSSVQKKSEHLMTLLCERKLAHVQAVRGRGLLVGLELDCEAAPFLRAGHAAGILLLSAGPRVLRLLPPLVISEAQIENAVDMIERVLASV